jgi:hypothetical protein
MDIYCQRCGEPWDAYGARHGDMTPEEKERFFKGEDCPACHGKEVKKRPFRAQATAVLSDLLGDDIDGLAAELEDAEYLLGSSFWE